MDRRERKNLKGTGKETEEIERNVSPNKVSGGNLENPYRRVGNV